MRKTIIGLVFFMTLAVSGGLANSAPYLVYDGSGEQDAIRAAMDLLQLSYDIRTPSNPVTIADLQSRNYGALVVGFNLNGDLSGLTPSVLGTGITGNILLTGHDPDVHATQVPPTGGNPNAQTNAQRFMTQALSFGSSGPATGLVAFADFEFEAFAYLPPAYGITATGFMLEESISSFTDAGVASGIFAGLTPADMSNWINSYHTVFNTWGTQFTPYELGNNNNDTVTIGFIAPATPPNPPPDENPNPVPEPATLTLLGAGLIGFVGFRKKFKKAK
jgi:hypothetical protein